MREAGSFIYLARARCRGDKLMKRPISLLKSRPNAIPISLGGKLHRPEWVSEGDSVPQSINQEFDFMQINPQRLPSATAAFDQDSEQRMTSASPQRDWENLSC